MNKIITLLMAESDRALESIESWHQERPTLSLDDATEDFIHRINKTGTVKLPTI